MSQVITYSRFWQRRDTPSAWSLANPVLHDGEIGVAQAPGESPDVVTRWKVGDGVTAWNALPYMGPGALPTDPGDLLYADANGQWQTLPKGAAAQILTMSGGLPAWQTGSAAGGAGLTLLGTATVSGAAATSFTLSGLDLSAYRSFRIEVALKNATGSAATVSLYYNGDTTATNYWRQTLPASSTTSSPTRGNDGQILPMAATTGIITALIHVSNDVDGKPRAIVNYNRDAAAAIIVAIIAHIRDTAANITNITLSSSVASSLAIGSKFVVFGVG